MKGFSVFIALCVAATAANAAAVHKVTPNNKNIVDDLQELQKCMSNVMELLTKISDDVLTEVRGLQALVEGATAQVEECSAGIDNPSITEQIEIAKCIRQVYQEFSFDLLSVIHIIQDSLHSIIQIPSLIEECMSGARANKGIVEEIEVLKACMENVIDLINKVSADVQGEVDKLQDIIQAGSAKAEACFAGIENPTASEMIEIAKCLVPVYQQVGSDVAAVVVEIEHILLTVAQIPSVIGECMAGTGSNRGIIEDIEALKVCMKNAVGLIQQVSVQIQGEIDQLQAIIQAGSAKAEECFAGIENPTASQMIEIAKCLVPVYQQVGSEISAVIIEIEEILLTVAEIPSIINNCRAESGSNKGIVDEIEALKVCMKNVVDLINKISADIQGEVDKLQGIIQAGSAKAEACFAGIENPTASEMIEIAKCLVPVYQQVGSEVAAVIVEIENILLTVAQIPSVIDECMAGGPTKNVIDDVNHLKECVQKAVELLKQIGSDIATSVGSLQGPLATMQEKAELCLAGVVNPAISEMLQIAECLRPVYAEFGTSVSLVVEEIQTILQEVQQIPSNINACLAA